MMDELYFPNYLLNRLIYNNQSYYFKIMRPNDNISTIRELSHLHRTSDNNLKIKVKPEI